MRKFDYMKFEKSGWDSETLGLIAQIHEFKGRQEMFLKQKPDVLSNLVKIAKIQSTEYSNKIEGIVTTDKRIRELCSDSTEPVNRDEEEIMGYRDVLNTIHESYEFIPLKSSYILQLHRDLFKYSERSIGGVYKNTQNYIVEIGNDGNARTRFTPLEPYETPDAVERLCESFNRSIDSCVVDPLILIPIFVNDFLCIHPFSDGNGRMSRLLTTLLLYRCDYFVGKYISIERKIENTKSAYYSALKKSNANWLEGKNTYTPFIKYMLKIILSAYRDFESRVDIFGKNKSAYTSVGSAVNEKIGKFTKNDIVELVPSYSRASIENSLKRLTDEGIITRHGNGKNTFYTRNN